MGQPQSCQEGKPLPQGQWDSCLVLRQAQEAMPSVSKELLKGTPSLSLINCTRTSLCKLLPCTGSPWRTTQVKSLTSRSSEVPEEQQAEESENRRSPLSLPWAGGHFMQLHLGLVEHSDDGPTHIVILFFSGDTHTQVRPSVPSTDGTESWIRCNWLSPSEADDGPSTLGT